MPIFQKAFLSFWAIESSFCKTSRVGLTIRCDFPFSLLRDSGSTYVGFVNAPASVIISSRTSDFEVNFKSKFSRLSKSIVAFDSPRVELILTFAKIDFKSDFTSAFSVSITSLEVRVSSELIAIFAFAFFPSKLADMSAVPREIFENLRRTGWLRICGNDVVRFVFAEIIDFSLRLYSAVALPVQNEFAPVPTTSFVNSTDTFSGLYSAFALADTVRFCTKYFPSFLYDIEYAEADISAEKSFWFSVKSETENAVFSASSSGTKGFINANGNDGAFTVKTLFDVVDIFLSAKL